MDGIPHDLVEPFILSIAAETYFTIADEGGKRKLKEHLVIEVFSYKRRILYTFFKQDVLYALRNKTRQKEGAYQNHH
jgi:hypothetical protein